VKFVGCGLDLHTRPDGRFGGSGLRIGRIGDVFEDDVGRGLPDRCAIDGARPRGIARSLPCRRNRRANDRSGLSAGGGSQATTLVYHNRVAKLEKCRLSTRADLASLMFRRSAVRTLSRRWQIGPQAGRH
jgi:hypothetical protein